MLVMTFAENKICDIQVRQKEALCIIHFKEEIFFINPFSQQFSGIRLEK